jgi:hypothetical protein
MVQRHSPDDASQLFTVPSSEPETRFRPSGLLAQPSTHPEWLWRIRRHSPDDASQSLRVPSSAPETSRRPSGLHAQAFTHPE